MTPLEICAVPAVVSWSVEQRIILLNNIRDIISDSIALARRAGLGLRARSQGRGGAGRAG